MSAHKSTSLLMLQRLPLVPLPIGDLKHRIIPIIAPSSSERQGSVMAVRMSQTIQKELDVIPSQITYWTDSTTVLSYIKSQGTRFHTFVSNRVAEIKEVSDPETWRHVPGRLNVADDCSRGLSAPDLLQDTWWCPKADFKLSPHPFTTLVWIILARC